MGNQFNESLKRYQLTVFDDDWGALQRGIEKESLRVKSNGNISHSPHPNRLGSALTNPYITTDFSEALLELITPVSQSIDDCLEELENIHRYTQQNIENDEILWATSMPCPLSADTEIPIAQYGKSNIGKLKTLYRHGLHHRYGSLMQAIAGIHYNFSMPDSFWESYKPLCKFKGSIQEFKTEKYLHLIRNFHRFSWLLLYLFGASPTACKCFVEGREHNLSELDDSTLFKPFATCLRMGNLGYKSEAQQSLFVCYNDLETYVECLGGAIKTPYPEYVKIGHEKDGKYKQINTNLLQLENEFYSTIRPKRNVKNGEKPLDALTNRGIEYVEVRALDLDPYSPVGINREQIHFLDSFLLHCLLAESPDCNKDEFFEVGNNLNLVVNRGREANLRLSSKGKQRVLREWSMDIINDIKHSAFILDKVNQSNEYSLSAFKQEEKIKNPKLTPSGRMLDQMKKEGMSFFEFSMEHSKRHSKTLREAEIDKNFLTHMKNVSSKSLFDQQEIEKSDSTDFKTFLDQWNNF